MKAAHPLTRGRWLLANGALLALTAVAVATAVAVGSERVALSEAWGSDERARAILFSARLPRALLAAFVGMALASAGGAFQAILANPLADPFILGVSGGAALGSVLAIGLKLPFEGVSAAAFAFALLSMAAIHLISGARGRSDRMTLLLTGVIFNAFCFALILFVNAVVTMEQAYQILFMLIGNLDAVDLRTVALAGVLILAGFAALCLLAGRMNLLSLGDEAAKSLGVNAGRARAAIFFAASLMVGTAVALSGLIGFVGLFIPHAVRMIFGADHRLVIPASGLAGAAFLVAADTAARTILMRTGLATELPVGVITALIGAPLFFVLLRRRCAKG